MDPRVDIDVEGINHYTAAEKYQEDVDNTEISVLRDLIMEHPYKYLEELSEKDHGKQVRNYR